MLPLTSRRMIRLSLLRLNSLAWMPAQRAQQRRQQTLQQESVQMLQQESVQTLQQESMQSRRPAKEGCVATTDTWHTARLLCMRAFLHATALPLLCSTSHPSPAPRPCRSLAPACHRLAASGGALWRRRAAGLGWLPVSRWGRRARCRAGCCCCIEGCVGKGGQACRQAVEQLPLAAIGPSSPHHPTCLAPSRLWRPSHHANHSSPPPPPPPTPPPPHPAATWLCQSSSP